VTDESDGAEPPVAREPVVRRLYLLRPKSLSAKAGELHYAEHGQTYYEEKYKERLLHNLSKRAKELGFQLTPFEPATVSVS
jgi:hypothetical protein